MDDYLVENIEAALSDRESGALEKTALYDDLHVTRGKAEQLEARLRRQAAEEEVRVRVRGLDTVYASTRKGGGGGGCPL